LDSVQLELYMHVSCRSSIWTPHCYNGLRDESVAGNYRCWVPPPHLLLSLVPRSSYASDETWELRWIQLCRTLIPSWT
jgi:hypothetical protein